MAAKVAAPSLREPAQGSGAAEWLLWSVPWFLLPVAAGLGAFLGDVTAQGVGVRGTNEEGIAPPRSSHAAPFLLSLGVLGVGAFALREAIAGGARSVDASLPSLTQALTAWWNWGAALIVGVGTVVGLFERVWWGAAIRRAVDERRAAQQRGAP